MSEQRRSSPAGLRPLLHRARGRRIERIRREIAMLEQMDEVLFRKALVWALLGIPAIAAVLVGLAAKLHWLGGSPAMVVGLCVAAAAALYWIGRYALWVPVIVVAVALAIILEGGLDFPDWRSSDTSKPEKPSRKDKLDRALSRRRALLAWLEGRTAD